MKKAKLTGLSVLLVGMGLCIGCSSLGRQITGKTGSIFGSSETERVYKADYSTTFRACVDTLRRLDGGAAKLVRYNEGLIVFQWPDRSSVLTAQVTKVDGATSRVQMTAKDDIQYWFDRTDDDMRKLFFAELDKSLGSAQLVGLNESKGTPPPRTSNAAEPPRILEVPKVTEVIKPVSEVKTPATEPAKSAGGAADHPSDEKTPEKDSEERKLLLTRLAQTLQLNENDQFLRKLSDGELALLQGRLESLQKFAEKQGEISDKCAACYVDLARLYHDSGQYARAAEALKAALAVEPESALAHCNLGEIYKHLNLVDDAIRELELAKTLNPELTDAYINLGIIYDDYLVNDQKAIECYRRYLSLGGSDKQVIEWIKAIEKGS